MTLDLVTARGRRLASSTMPTVFVLALALLGCLFAFPLSARADGKTPAWWEAETAMGPGGQLSLKTQPWWDRAAKLGVGEQFTLKSDKPGGGTMLVRREQFNRNGKPEEAIIWVLDDDGDMRPGDKDGDKDSDCYVADYGGDGVVDRMVDYIDNNGDGKHDEMDIRYFDGGRLRRAWFGVDLDRDGHTWNVTHYEYPGGDFFECDPYGDNMIYFNGYDPERNAWFPASECPFSFHDADGDGQTEAVVRVSGVPMSFDPVKQFDCANNVDYSSKPPTDATRAMGALNIRYGVDVDGGSNAERPLHCDLGFNMIGRVPYQFDGMKLTNPLRREPKTTICIPHASARAVAESYPADQTGFSWREFSDDSIRIGYGPHADEDHRWEGIFWTWGRRPMHNTGGPCQAWNMRREFQPTPSTRRELYYSRVDRRIHLKGATEGWTQVGHLGDKRPWGEIRSFDTNSDGYFDRWEVYREGQATPARVSTAIDPGVRELPSDWDKLTELYTKELLPEARRANQQLMAAMRRVDPAFVAPEALTKALAAAASEAEKRYVEDMIREEQYLALREKLLARSGAWLAKDSTPERILSMAPDRSADSAAAWELAQRIARLDAAYGEGRYDDAVKLLECGDSSPLSCLFSVPVESGDESPQSKIRGVWYQCGGKNNYPGKPFVYSGPMATYSAWHRPMAVHVASRAKTYFVFGNEKNSPAISCYDHRTKRIATPVVLGSNPDGDAHRNPTLLVDEQGYLYVFYGAHGHPTHVVKSVEPYKIDRWTKAADIDDPKTCYPQPWQLRAGELFVSYREAADWQNGLWCVRRSTDAGRSWQPRTVLIRYPGCSIYAVSVAETGGYPRKVHIAWSRLGGGTPEEVATKDLWARRYHVYYARSDDGGETWRRSDGSPYSLPIDEAQAEKVYDCGQRGVWLKDIQLDRNGNPLVLFIDSECREYKGTWKVASRMPTGWRIADVARSDHMYDDGALVVRGEKDIRLFAPTGVSQPHEDGGEIAEWQSTDAGATWRQLRALTAGSPFSHNNVKTVLNAAPDFEVFWSHGDSHSPPKGRDVDLYYFGEMMERPCRMAAEQTP